jgi:ectoine hydroxylase-related dioxygenase (phytanoyl-CoA dioxygenase family)
MKRVVSEENVAFFRDEGYLRDLPPVLRRSELDEILRGFDRLVALLQPGENHREIRRWHQTSRFLYDLCTHGVLLDYIEALIGPNFFVWESHFYVKDPRSMSVVGWHQDDHFRQFDPPESITASLAFEDRHGDNGDLRVLPRTHLAGRMLTPGFGDPDLKEIEMERGTFATSAAVTMALSAGQAAFHHDRIVHGSLANRTDNRRVGFNIRYAPTSVKCDVNRDPTFKAYLCRGVDEYGHNPVGCEPTTKFARP